MLCLSVPQTLLLLHRGQWRSVSDSPVELHKLLSGQMQAAEKALAQAAEQQTQLKERAQALRMADQDARQRQLDAAEREAELKAFEQNLTVSSSALLCSHR